MPIIIEEQEALEMLSQLDAWKIVDSGLEKEFNFADFNSAFEFMGQVGILAEQHNHHPDWFNSYNHLLIILTTHEVGGITERDFALAKSIDELDYTSKQ